MKVFARKTDPATSHMAAAEARKTADTKGAKILSYLKAATRGYTANELAQVSHMRLNTVSTMMSKLEQDGAVIKTGYLRRNFDTNMWGIVYSYPDELDRITDICKADALRSENETTKLADRPAIVTGYIVTCRSVHDDHTPKYINYIFNTIQEAQDLVKSSPQNSTYKIHKIKHKA